MDRLITTTLYDIRMVRDRAVQAERERCAEIAHLFVNGVTDGPGPLFSAGVSAGAVDIEKKIREGK